MRSMLFLMTWICVTSSYAQFNDSTNYYIKHSSTGSLNKTNDQNSYVLNNTLRFNFYKRNFSVNTINSWVYGKQQHILANNDYRLRLILTSLKRIVIYTTGDCLIMTRVIR
jgi:hypothetical protein